MLTLQGELPRELYLAVSGGVDSIAALDFLRKNHKVHIVHVNHAEGNSDEAETLVRKLASKHRLPIRIHSLSGIEKPNQLSKEEFWRVERYKLFHSLSLPVVTCHHLDDCVETWIWSALNGEAKLLPYANCNVIRPFRLTPKQELVSWAERNKLRWVTDESNSDTSLTRNYIRHVMMPNVLQVNPGIQKTILKKLKAQNV